MKTVESIIDLLLEKRLNISNQLITRFKQADPEFATKLEELDTEEAVDYLDVDVESNYITYIRDEKAQKLNDDEKWSKYRQKISIGKFIKQVMPELTNKKIEYLTNAYKSTFNGQIEVVKGDRIKWAYLEDNYKEDIGILSTSCLKSKWSSHLLDVYVNNPDAISLAVLTNGGLIITRALLWKLETGEIFMDKIYSTDISEVELFKRWAASKGYITKPKQNNEIYQTELKLNSVKFNISDIENFPYIDTLKYLYVKNEYSAYFSNQLVNPEVEGDKLYDLQAQNGVSKKEGYECIKLHNGELAWNYDCKIAGNGLWYKNKELKLTVTNEWWPIDEVIGTNFGPVHKSMIQDGELIKNDRINLKLSLVDLNDVKQLSNERWDIKDIWITQASLNYYGIFEPKLNRVKKLTTGAAKELSVIEVEELIIYGDTVQKINDIEKVDSLFFLKSNNTSSVIESIKHLSPIKLDFDFITISDLIVKTDRLEVLFARNCDLKDFPKIETLKVLNIGGHVDIIDFKNLPNLERCNLLMCDINQVKNCPNLGWIINTEYILQKTKNIISKWSRKKIDFNRIEDINIQITEEQFYESMRGDQTFTKAEIEKYKAYFIRFKQFESRFTKAVMPTVKSTNLCGDHSIIEPEECKIYFKVDRVDTSRINDTKENSIKLYVYYTIDIDNCSYYNEGIWESFYDLHDLDGDCINYTKMKIEEYLGPMIEKIYNIDRNDVLFMEQRDI